MLTLLEELKLSESELHTAQSRRWVAIDPETGSFLVECEKGLYRSICRLFVPHGWREEVLVFPDWEGRDYDYRTVAARDWCAAATVANQHLKRVLHRHKTVGLMMSMSGVYLVGAVGQYLGLIGG